MGVDPLQVLHPSLVVELPLPFLLLCKLSLVLVHEGVLFISALLDLVGKIRVLGGDPDLLL